MRRVCSSIVACLAGLVILPVCQFPTWAKDRQSVSTAPGFQFNQVDVLCVMPVVDDRKTGSGDSAYGLWLDAMRKVEEKGYRLADPSCSRDVDAKGRQTKWHWTLTVRLDDFTAEGAPGITAVRTGTLLIASLFDTESAREVWKSSSTPLYMTKVGSGSSVELSNGIGPLFSSFEKRKKTPTTQDTMWQPFSMTVRIIKGHTFGPACNGLLKFDSDNLSFEPSSNGKDDEKCTRLQFSVPASGIKTYPSLRMMNLPGRGYFILQQPDASRDPYLFVALNNLR